MSELSKAKPHAGVLVWYREQPLSSFAIPSIVLYELQAGIEKTRAQHPIRAKELDRWTDQLIQTIPILQLDAAASRETARLIHGKSLDLLEDAMIAAIAKVNGLRVVTRNTKDFAQFGVPLLNPFLNSSP